MKNIELSWQRIKFHIEFSESFFVGFLFSEDIESVSLLKEHFQNNFMPQFILPKNTEELSITLLDLYTSQQEYPNLFWVDLFSEIGLDWNARFNFIMRLNEHREKLKKLKCPLIIILPIDMKKQTRELAPDLWAIRSFAIEI